MERTKAALDCWQGLKDSESLLNPYGALPSVVVKDPPTSPTGTTVKRERQQDSRGRADDDTKVGMFNRLL